MAENYCRLSFTRLTPNLLLVVNVYSQRGVILALVCPMYTYLETKISSYQMVLLLKWCGNWHVVKLKSKQ